MTAASTSPWASGPSEILRHGLTLMKKDSDSNRRLALISIDNSVELMIKTYLGLPHRINGLTITRKQVSEASETFPALLDALNAHAPAKLDGIDLRTIEWYHRLRNQLYHQGNGLTVERDKVEAYAVLANQLFHNLFGVVLLDHVTDSADVLGEFIEGWTFVERGLSALMSREAARRRDTMSRPRPVSDVVDYLVKTHLLSPQRGMEIQHFRYLRNEVLHGKKDFRKSLTPAIVSRVKEIAKEMDVIVEGVNAEMPNLPEDQT